MVQLDHRDLPASRPPISWILAQIRRFSLPLWLYGLSTFLTIIVVEWADVFVPRQPHWFQEYQTDALEASGISRSLGNWDGVWYAHIVRHGYTPGDRLSSRTIVFFPAYPLLARFVVVTTGASPELALLMVAHASFAAALVLFGMYLTARTPKVGGKSALFVLLTLTFWPLGVFFRVTYTESLFLCLTAAYFLAESRGAHPLMLGAIAAVGCVTRPVGIVFPLLTMVYCLSYKARPASVLVRISAAALSVSGMLAFMAYQRYAFGSWFAFALAQERWRPRAPAPLMEHIWRILTAEPLWSVFVPQSEAYWARNELVTSPVFSMQFWNPIIFLGCTAILLWGWLKGQLTRNEALFGGTVLLIPYVVHASGTSMYAQGRFTLVCLPVYLVVGRFVSQLPVVLRWSVLIAFAAAYCLIVAGFAAWYRNF